MSVDFHVLLNPIFTLDIFTPRLFSLKTFYTLLVLHPTDITLNRFYTLLLLGKRQNLRPGGGDI